MIAEAECKLAPRPALLMLSREPDVSFGAILTFAAACGLIVANIYYTQQRTGLGALGSGGASGFALAYDAPRRDNRRD
jgi:hypothetical protein